MRRLRYGVVGTGHRAGTWVGGLLAHPDAAELVALLDPSPTRLAVHAADVEAAGAPAPQRWHPDRLEEVVREQRLDRVVVTAPDHAHAALVVRALEAGADVVVEKPLTTTADGVRSIAGAVARTGRRVTVGFNYRYSPRNAALREVLASGAVGRVLSVHFEWLLDTGHGADYFRRWHRDKAASGGLGVHKASHHHDLVGWWLQAAPTRVTADGGVRFYGDAGAGRPAGRRPERGTGAPADDPWSLDLRGDDRLRALYLDAEHDGDAGNGGGGEGYRRDVDPFAPGVTTEDTLSLLVGWSGPGGAPATMSYSLTAHSPWEGYRVAVNGTAGRTELDVVERSWVPGRRGGGGVVDPSAAGSGTGAADSAEAAAVRPEGARLVVQRHWEPAREVEVDEGAGGHGGGDERMLRDVVVGGALGRPAADDDPLGRAADWHDGVRAVAVGLAGDLSLAQGRTVAVTELDLGVDVVAPPAR